MQRQIRLDKFEQVLPRAMRDARHRHVDRRGEGEPPRSALGGSRPRLRLRDRLLRLHRSRRRPDRARGARPERLPPRAVGRLRHLRAGVDAGGVRQGAQPQAHRRQHVRRDRTGRRALPHDAPAPREDARRAVRLAPGQRRAAGQRVPLAPRRVRDRRVRRSRRASRSSSPSARCRTRSSRPARRRSRTSRGGCRIACWSAASAPSSTCRRSTSPVPKGIAATSTHAHHPAGRRDDDRLGRAADELRHRRQARRLRAEAGRGRAAEEHPGRVRQGARRARRAEEGDQARASAPTRR